MIMASARHIVKARVPGTINDRDETSIANPVGTAAGIYSRGFAVRTITPPDPAQQ
jgi:hypothetical protein